MSDRTMLDLDRLRPVLETLGYDIEEEERRRAVQRGALVARRDRGDRSHLVVFDRGGRFRGVVTLTVNETARATALDGVALRVVTVDQRVVTTIGQAPDETTALRLVEALDRIAAPDAPPDPDAPIRADAV
ncbi:MAG: hypothetical protein IT337_02315 [Thermomicrobiales bacterium]|nr:hypothetical protein [Thermomicrobiales bacterium]